MSTTDIPLSASEYWDQMALEVKRARGKWVVVEERVNIRQGGRNATVVELLERRGLKVEVKSRVGNNTPERPWVGVRTFARTI